MSLCRNPSASPIRMPGGIEHGKQQPVSQPVAAIRMVCTSTGDSTRGSFFGAVSAITRRGFGSLLLM